MQPISEYCRQEVLGWVKFDFTAAKPGAEQYSCGFYRNDGIHFMASVRDYNAVRVIHVTLAPLLTVTDLSEGELIQYIFEQTPGILEDFFPGRTFARQPDDPRRPQAKHYFSLLE